MLAGQSFSFAFLQSSLNSNPPPFFLNNKPCVFPLDHEIGVQCDREVDVRHLFICFKVIVIINAYSESFDYGLIAKIKFFFVEMVRKMIILLTFGMSVMSTPMETCIGMLGGSSYLA